MLPKKRKKSSSLVNKLHLEISSEKNQTNNFLYTTMHSTKKNTSHLKTDAILTSEMDKEKNCNEYT